MHVEDRGFSQASPCVLPACRPGLDQGKTRKSLPTGPKDGMVAVEKRRFGRTFVVRERHMPGRVTARGLPKKLQSARGAPIFDLERFG